MRDDREIVPSIRRALAERIGVHRYEMWIAGSTRFEIADRRLIVAVPNSFVQDWLRTHFRNHLEDVTREALGDDASVTFEVDPQLSGRRGEAIAAAATLVPPAPANPEVAAMPALRLHQPAAAAASTATATPSAAAVKRVTAPRRLGEFGEYVVGATNRLAYTAAQGVVERLGQISPLVLHGPSGVGKTHLVEAMVGATRRRHDDARTAYLTAEQFTTEFLEALHGRGLPNFRRKFRDLHLLVVDDLHFLEGKKATIVEFAHTLDQLQRDGRQVVITLDRPADELAFIGTELRTRLAAGLACRVEVPDLTMRLDIVGRMATKLGLALPEDVCRYVAVHFSAHVRELAGALKRLLVARQAYDRPIDLELAESALAELVRGRCKTVRPSDIERAVCDVFGLAADALQSPRKGKDVSQPRMLAMWLARKYTRSALSEIGCFFGGRSHSTVISALKKVDGWAATQEPLRVAAGRCTFDEAVRKVEQTLQSVAG